MKILIVLFGLIFLFFMFSGCTKNKEDKKLKNLENVKDLSEEDKKVIYFTERYRKESKTNKSENEFIKNYPQINMNGRIFYLCEGDLLIEESEFAGYVKNWGELNSNLEIKSQILGWCDEKGNLIRWNPGSELTYSVQKNSFANEEQYKLVVQNMLLATRDWERACNIKFKYIETYDVNQEAKELIKLVTFVIFNIDVNIDVIASSFFPNDPEYKRFLVIYPGYFNSKYNKVGILRHEIGHILGFRHEHIRTEVPIQCIDSFKRESLNNILNLTNYDRNSVMHYICGNLAGNYELSITDKDIRGARILYDSLAK